MRLLVRRRHPKELLRPADDASMRLLPQHRHRHRLVWLPGQQMRSEVMPSDIDAHVFEMSAFAGRQGRVRLRHEEHVREDQVPRSQRRLHALRGQVSHLGHLESQIKILHCPTSSGASE